jgi:hypothetical protein
MFAHALPHGRCAVGPRRLGATAGPLSSTRARTSSACLHCYDSLLLYPAGLARPGPAAMSPRCCRTCCGPRRLRWEPTRQRCVPRRLRREETRRHQQDTCTTGKRQACGQSLEHAGSCCRLSPAFQRVLLSRAASAAGPVHHGRGVPCVWTATRGAIAVRLSGGLSTRGLWRAL